MKVTDNDPTFWDRWSVNENEPGLASMIAAFAVLVLFLLAVLVCTLFFWSGT